VTPDIKLRTEVYLKYSHFVRPPAKHLAAQAQSLRSYLQDPKPRHPKLVVSTKRAAACDSVQPIFSQAGLTTQVLILVEEGSC
jgi:hypothetical protein